MQLEELQRVNRTALWDLAMKCRDSSHFIGPMPGDLDPLTTLQKYGLLDADENVRSPVIERIVLNAIEDIENINDDARILNLVLRNPLANPQPCDPLPESNRWKWCVIL
jgi:hypothetical protein